MNGKAVNHTPENMARTWGMQPAGVARGAREGLSAAVWHLDLQDSYEVFAEPDPLTHIISPALHGEIEVDLFIDGAWRYRDRMGRNGFNLVRAGEEPRSILHAPQMRLMHIYLPDALLRRSIEEDLVRGADGFELQPLKMVHDPVVGSIAAAIEAEMTRPAIGSSLMIDGLTLQLASHMVRQWSNRSGISAACWHARGGLAPWQLRRCVDFLQAHAAHEVSLETLANLCDLSQFHFARQFKRSTGLPPHAYHLRLRIEQAQALMQDSCLPLADISAACGFASQQHFTTAFKRHLGTTPAAWRREQAR